MLSMKIVLTRGYFFTGVLRLNAPTKVENRQQLAQYLTMNKTLMAAWDGAERCFAMVEHNTTRPKDEELTADMLHIYSFCEGKKLTIALLNVVMVHYFKLDTKTQLLKLGINNQTLQKSIAKVCRKFKKRNMDEVMKKIFERTKPRINASPFYFK